MRLFSNDLTVAKLSPKEFELLVREFLENAGKKLTRFSAKHREVVSGSDGDFEIDVHARFEALGADFVVLVECKKQKKPVERDIVQILYDRIRSTGAHKGMIFSTAGYQSGAVHYAQQHGIALVAISSGKVVYQTKSHDWSRGSSEESNGLIWWRCVPEGQNIHLSRIRNVQEVHATVFAGTAS